MKVGSDTIGLTLTMGRGLRFLSLVNSKFQSWILPDIYCNSMINRVELLSGLLYEYASSLWFS